MMSERDVRIIEKLAKMCRADTPENNKRYRVFSLLTTKRGQPICYGKNSYIKTHPIQAEYAQGINEDQIFLHAEISVLVKNTTKNAHTLYVVRVLRSGDYAQAKPCEVCQLAIQESGIKRVVHTTDLGFQEYLT